MSEITRLNLREEPPKPTEEEISAAEKMAIEPEMSDEVAGERVDQMNDTGVRGEFKKEGFWARYFPKRLREKIGVGAAAGMMLLNPSFSEGRSGSQLKSDTEITNTTVENKGSDWHWTRAMIRGEDGKTYFNPWVVLLSPGQAERFWETIEHKRTVFELPYEYSRLFDTGKPLSQEDQNKITEWIVQKLKQEFGEKVSMFGLWDADKGSLGARDVYRTEHPESGGSEHAKITGISIMGYASFDGPQAKGPDSLKPGRVGVDPENLDLGMTRAKAALGLTEEGLKKLGVSQEQWDEAAKVLGGRELSPSDAEMADLADLAKGEAGADPLEQIFHLTVKYNDYLEAKKDNLGTSDPYLDPMMGKLDEIIGSKRKVKITITYEENKKETTLIPIPLLPLIFLLRLRKGKKPQPEPEPTPEPPTEPPIPPTEPPMPPEEPPTPEDKNQEEEVWIRDLYVYFEDPDTIRLGLSYEAIADELHSRFDSFGNDGERIDFLTLKILQGWKEKDKAARQEAGDSDLETGLDYENQPQQIKWAKKHAKALLWVVKVRMGADERGETRSYTSIMEPRVRRMILRETLRHGGKVEKSEKEEPETISTKSETLEPEEKSEALYSEALEKRNSTLQAFRAMNSFRKNKKIGEMTPEEISEYERLKADWQSKRENSFSAWEKLSKDEQDKLSAVVIIVDDAPVKPAPAEVKIENSTETVSGEGAVTELKSNTEQSVEEAVNGSTVGETGVVERPVEETGEITMEEIDRMIEHAKRTGRVPGIGPEGLAYWEARKTELLERQKADLESRKARELKLKIKELGDKLAEKQAYLDGEVAKKIKLAKDTGRVPGIGPDGLAYWGEEEEKIKQEIKDLKKELNKLEKELKSVEKGVGKSFKDRAKEAFEKAKNGIVNAKEKFGEKYEAFKGWLGNREEEPKQPATEVVPNRKEVAPSKWGWFKERAKGFATVGVWEFFRAEQFRTGTGYTANDIEAYAGQVAKDKNLSLEEAEVYAWRTFAQAGGRPSEGSVDNSAFASVVNRKDRENSEFIERAVEHAVETIKEKLGTERKRLGTYKGEAGQDVLTEENITAIKTEIRSELEKIRFGAAVKDLKNFRELLRGNLDEKWWLRYIWGAAEAALWGAGIAHVTMPGAEQVISVAGGEAGKVTTEVTVKAFEQTLNQNVWHTLETMSKVHLSPKQLMDLSQQVLDTNGMFEQEWTTGIVNNLLSSRSLPVGMQIKIPLAVMKAMGYLL